MRLISKITWLSTILGAFLIVILVLVSLFSFRYFSLGTAESLARTSAEIVRVAMTEQMINGVVGKRATFLSRLEAIEGFKTARVIRGPEVVAQFGAGLDTEMSRDEVEEQVLSTGQPYFGLDENSESIMFRATIPYIARSQGEPNCTSCHQVSDGAVLGAITLTLSISHLRSQALLTVALMMVPVLFFAVLLVFLFRRMTRPLSETAHDLQMTVEKSLEGDFTGRIEARTTDEIGLIAGEVNQLMGFLYDGLNDISGDVAELIQCEPAESNMLESTREMVGRLIDAAQFKQSIEEDETRQEVYERLARVIEEDFAVSQYSVYEVDSNKNRIRAVIIDGTSDGDCKWCDPQILIRPEACRARRTGHIIDAVETPMICNAFLASGEQGEMSHICVPVIQSGSVGSVVQMVFPQSESARIQSSIAYLKVYLREAAPVIEAKRLMDTLRESNLRDPMTGLHNRRFLEEYIDTVVASVQRRKNSLAILMLDLDFFKKVNDTHGHDAGDSVLKELSKILTGSVRSSDLVIRYGGEEFLIILQDSSGDYGDATAEKIRAAVEAKKFAIAGGVLKKTISAGVSYFPGDSDAFWQALKYADVALYKAKNDGRNRVVRFSSEMWSESEEY